MMKVSTRGRYGLRIMLELALNFDIKPVPVEFIEKNQGISGKYVHVLVTGLKKSGLILASRGPGGGYRLARNPRDINVLQILKALEGKTGPADCVGDECTCSREHVCAASDVWRHVASRIDETLSGLSLEELVVRQREKDMAERKGSGRSSEVLNLLSVKP